MFIIEIILPDYSRIVSNGDIDESAVDIICDKMFGFYYAKIRREFSQRFTKFKKEKSLAKLNFFTL
jgi:hypothetical protein